MLKDFKIKKAVSVVSLLYKTNRFHVAACVCSVIDHRRRQNVVRTSVTHSAIASCATYLFYVSFFLFLIYYQETVPIKLITTHVNAKVATLAVIVKLKSMSVSHLHAFVVSRRSVAKYCFLIILSVKVGPSVRGIKLVYHLPIHLTWLFYGSQDVSQKFSISYNVWSFWKIVFQDPYYSSSILH